jgi:DNA-binding NtrC family response regulator
MRQPGIAATSVDALKVLSVSPFENDHASLEAIIRHSKWKLYKAEHRAAAVDLLRKQDVSVVLCEHDLNPGTWMDLLAYVNEQPHPPCLIVTSRLADDRLWAEALNLGAWDVLAKPFEVSEVLRTVRTAWHHRRDRMTIGAAAVMRAAS